MPIKDNLLNIDNFVLTTSSEVNETINRIKSLHNNHMLIHVASFIHNTVLVQNLEKALVKNFVDSKVILLHHSDKNATSLTVFSTDGKIGLDKISDDILKELHLVSAKKDINLKDYRNQLFHRYFTDNLTNLPNLYQLRKDLQNDDSLGLILLKVDNFQTINNFYGFVVGDYVIESVSSHLKRLCSH